MIDAIKILSTFFTPSSFVNKEPAFAELRSNLIGMYLKKLHRNSSLASNVFVSSMSTDKNYDLRGTQVWPTMFFTRHWDEMSTEGAKLLSYLNLLRSGQREAIESQVAIGAKSAHGIYESNFDLFLQPEECLQKLVRFIEATLATAVCIANDQEATPQDVQIQIVDSWYHLTNDGGFHDAHFHHGCSWCGIFYLETGASGKRIGQSAPNGGSRFYCPFNLGGSYRDFGNKYLSASLDPPIKRGLLLLFPSYLMHSGLPYQGDEDRAVIAFNAQVHLKQGSLSASRIVKPN